jgi:nicotinamidase-related amidase
MNISSKGSALLVMDVQNSIVKNLPSYTQLIDNISKAISLARSNQMYIIYIIVGFRSGMPEVSIYNKVFSGSKERSKGRTNVSNAMDIYDTIAPGENDIIVTKRRISAFTGSDLEVLLRSLGVNRLFLTGVATSGVVLSTLCEAADKDYSVTVLSDCCADYNEDVHNMLIQKVFPFQSTIATVADFGSK